MIVVKCREGNDLETQIFNKNWQVKEFMPVRDKKYIKYSKDMHAVQPTLSFSQALGMRNAPGIPYPIQDAIIQEKSYTTHLCVETWVCLCFKFAVCSIVSHRTLTLMRIWKS